MWGPQQIRYCKGIWSVATTRTGSWIGSVDLGRKWLVDFNARKTELVLFYRSNSTGAIVVKMGLFLRKNLLRCWGLLSLLNWVWAFTLSLLLKLPQRKLEPWFVLWSFFLLRLLCISINLPCSHAWNTVFIIWAGATGCYLESLDKLQKWIGRSVGPSLAASL